MERGIRNEKIGGEGKFGRKYRVMFHEHLDMKDKNYWHGYLRRSQILTKFIYKLKIIYPNCFNDIEK